MNDGPGLRILVVEDNPVDALLVQSALESMPVAPAEIITRERLAGAVEFLSRETIDVVLLDLGLPDSSGIQTFTTLHTDCPHAAVVVLTGLDDDATGLEAMRRGAQDYLVKRDIHSSTLGRSLRYAVERQRITAELVASEERFHLAVTGASAGLWDWDPRSDKVYFAPRFKEILGYADHELPNDLAVFRANIHPDDLPITHEISGRFARGERDLDIDYRVLTKSGDYRWVNSRGRALWNRKGELHRVVGWILDITERKLAEEALRESSEKLRRLAARLQAVREAESIRIARLIHDDLGQSLTGIKMDLRWLTRKLGPAQDTASLLAKIAEIEELSDRTIETVQRIAIELRPSVLDSLGLGEAIRDEARRFETRTGLTVSVSVPEDFHNPPVHVATACFRIYQELLTNIMRHAHAATVAISLAHDAGQLRLTVEDDGMGIPKGVFDRPSSLGLLGMSERAAELGGEIRLEGTSGLGTVATVVIPLTAINP
jgi:two-component system, NarL family, sensor histidine kinase UhpB